MMDFLKFILSCDILTFHFDISCLRENKEESEFGEIGCGQTNHYRVTIVNFGKKCILFECINKKLWIELLLDIIMDGRLVFLRLQTP